MFSHRQIPKNDPRTGSQPLFHNLNDAIAIGVTAVADLALSIDRKLLIVMKK